MKNIMIPLSEKWKELRSTVVQYKTVVLKYDKYVEFLKQTPALWMFIPVDKEGNPITNTKKVEYKGELESGSEDWGYTEEYQKALSRVYFKGFEIVDINSESTWIKHTKKGIDLIFINETYRSLGKPGITLNGEYVKTLEDLTPLNLELTGNHLK